MKYKKYLYPIFSVIACVFFISSVIVLAVSIGADYDLGMEVFLILLLGWVCFWIAQLFK